MSKKILAASGNGKYIESSAASLDEATGEVTIDKLNISSSLYVSGTNGLLNQTAGVVENLNLEDAVSGSVLWATGGKFQLSEISLETLGGDLEGLLSNARVASVENVVSGTLSLAAGGTGKTSIASGSLLALSQSNIPGSTQSIVTVNASGTQWVTTGSSILDITPLAEPIVYLYTGSVGASNAFTWTKPEGSRFVRVICQGGGATAGTFTLGYASSGGGGGGFSDVTFNAISIDNTVNIIAGKGGAGGDAELVTFYDNGGSSSFGNYIYADGGKYGLGYNNGGLGGIGYTFNGGVGGIAQADAPNVIGTAAGGGGAKIDAAAGKGGNVTIYGKTILGGAGGLASTTTSSYGQPGSTDNYLKFNKVIINNIPNQVMPNLISAGGGGGCWTGAGNCTSVAGGADFGSGAGGVAKSNQNNPGFSGNGGKGYVLIICY